ncbi:hypothetical protein QE440_004620 [Pseudomonas psychrotolerans]|uniref:DUF637 domain-containing protein n=2 Tax=Pseudomonas oryzihabitans TaxID=47885 RepID=A0AAJ2EYW3_9PSED|nr:hypothetical protein [Pseudomonas psychrotolerans]
MVLPTTVGHDLPHRYLVETNPALTDLKQFMSSDYLLGNLNYNPDTSWKRLGDGLYEQRLVQQAIVARTGQRFIDGLTSDEAQFKYLMDNAIASKQALGLSVGVSLTAAQVAALTHDIVWMEDQVINGEHVLVPVLYLAHANNRLAPNGALIQGSDVTLIAGNDLNNAGTLRATNNLTATANNDLVNSGLIQSGDRLSLTSTLGDITNRAGGIISGRDVSLTASRGDILNERTVTTHTASYAGQSLREDYADSAARIEAGNNLSLIAGRDINNVGSVLSAGGNATLIAGRDVNLISAQTQTGRRSGANNTSSSITQLTGSLTAGRDLGIGAGRNLTAVATTLSAGRNASLAAQENLTLGVAANESHSYSKSKKTTRQEDHVDQQITTLTAGGNVSLVARQGDLTLVASKVAAGGEAYLYAGQDLNLLAAQDSDYSLYDMKKKGSFGAKKTKRDEVTDVRNLGSEIKAGGNITLQSEGDQTYQAAKLQSGKDLTLDSGGDITFEAVKDLHQESHEKSNNNAFWVSSKGKGQTDETLRQTQIIAEGKVSIQAVEGLKIDVKEVNGQTVSQTIDAMVKADPNLAWIKQAEARGDVDWRQVKEIHDSFKYNNSGLGPASQMIIAIAMAVIIGPMAGGLMGGTVTQAAITTAATNAAVSTINNRGNLGAVLKDVTSSDSLKSYAMAGASAGIPQMAGYDATKLKFNTASAQAVGTKLMADTLARTLIYGGSFQDNLKQAALGTAVGIAGVNAANAIGDLGLASGSLSKIALHAALGGLMAEAMGGDFRSGALAAGASEAMVGMLGDKFLPPGTQKGSPEYQRGMSNLLAASQLVGVLAASLSDGDIQAAATVAANATANNYLRHQDVENLAKELQGCEARGDCQIVRVKYQAISDANSARAKNCQQTGDCQQIEKEILAGQQAMAQLQGPLYGQVEQQFGNQQWQDKITVQKNIIASGNKALDIEREREQAQSRQDAERLKNDPAALKQELNAQATDLARKDLEQQMASQADQLRDKLVNDAALRAEVGELLDYRERLAGAAASVAGGAQAIGEMLEPSVWDLLSPAAKAVKLSMIVAAMKGGAAEFKIGSQVAGELATIEQLSGKLNDLNAGKLPGEAELSKYYDKTPLGQAISEASKTGFGGAKGTLNTSLLDELTANGVKFIPENVIATTRDSVVFLETGNSKAGLQHIIEAHGSQFAQMGVPEAQIPEVVMRAASEGKLVGYQGSGIGRPIYELNINGQTQRIAVTVGNNGFVVGENPRGSVR